MNKSVVKTSARIVAAILVAALSIFVAAKTFTAPEFYADTMKYLDDKKVAVLELAGAATATSFAVSALHDDMGTAISNELADLSGYFLLIVSAIVFEKYFITLSAYAAFSWLIPFACALYFLFAVCRNDSFKRVAFRIFAFAIAICLLVPVSVRLSRLVEDVYDASVTDTVDSIKESTDELTGTETETAPTEEDKSWWAKLGDLLTDTVDDVKNGLSGAKEKINTVLSQFVDSIAVLIVTSCVIPIAILFALLWIIRITFGLTAAPRRYEGRPAERKEYAEKE